MIRFVGFALMVFSAAAMAGDVLTAPPAQPDPARTYVFYLHGKIVEEKGPNAVDARFGLYDYPAVLNVLGSRGAVVVSQQRAQDTDVATYAGSVVGQIERLIAAGVPENRIAVVGFSKGGAIALRVSSFLRRPDVRFVLLAACWREDEPQLRMTGRVLSIRESSDKLSPYSCKPIADKAEKPASFEEVVIDTGRDHGAFYLPRKEWTQPTLDFVHGASGR